ncbi:thiamine pyrophosphokinase [Panus rudis PR-1116 ss-1]|nr:thiamine pyrophosphokinase [Panus rudis PR-1116 ss-1]
MAVSWSIPFLEHPPPKGDRKYALILLNQPFSFGLFKTLWQNSNWRCCADGGANRLHDLLVQTEVDHVHDLRTQFLPHLIKGDLDSLRDDVREYYKSKDVPVVYDESQDSTDLMKCVEAITEKEQVQGGDQYEIIILGGLSGRLDQTIHTLSYLHKLRHVRQRVFAVNDENIGWVLVGGEHHININHKLFGPTCGLLPVGIDHTILTTRGLRWNLHETKSHFDGMVSTSNHLVPSEPVVTVKITNPIWWTMELRSGAFQAS